MFSSPNSFSITAIFWPCASVSTRLSSVVLPEPRKPVRMVAGIRLMDGHLWTAPGRAGVAGRERRISGRSRLFKVADLSSLPDRACGKLGSPLGLAGAALVLRCQNPRRPRRARRRQGRRPAEKRNLFERLVEFVVARPGLARPS